MAEPTTRFRVIPNDTSATDLNTEAKRLAAITGQTVVSTGAGNEADFGTVDISAGAANSGVLTLLWDVTADGGNTTVETFKLWLASNGFVEAASVIKFVALSGTDNGTPSSTENYTANATTASYTFADMDESEPGSANLFPTDEGASMALSTTSDDALMWAMYAAIASGETTGTYKGLDSGYELRFNLKYSYS
jgi:hypothetical protein